jgi:predicted metal-dependent peptidase
MQMCEINEIILASMNWGSVPDQMVEVIYQSTRGRVKYESILREFYASALSDNRRLTRSRPSRRFGFEQMGSFYKYMPKLIVALDCSGSVSSENLGIYLHILSQFFKYGIQGIDVITFDTIVNKEVTKLKKNKDKQIAIKGRGGTDFQPVVDYFCKHIDYDGMMIVTDGYAPVPQVPSFLKNKLLWIIDNKQCFESSRHRFSKTGRVCRIEI